MAPPPRGARPRGCNRDSSWPPSEAPAPLARRRLSPGGASLSVCPRPVPGPRAARRPRRGLGVASPQRGPHPGAPTPLTGSRIHFLQRRGPALRPQAGARRGKQPSAAATAGWRSSPQGPDPPAAAPEGPLPEGDRQPPSSGQGPFFYIGGTNGASIISAYCKSKGWRRIQDGRREDYTLKWCEVKSRDSYCSFREGEQLLYQLPNNSLLTTKIGLLNALRESSRASTRGPRAAQGPQPKVLKMEEFFPETYRLDIRDEREAFFALFDETQMWICKPTASNQGKGIFLLRSQEEVAALQTKTQSLEDDPIYRKMWFRMPQARVVQRYIQNPLLLDGKKFDVRSYLLIACAVPCMVFFSHGYARLTLSLYNPHSRDLSGHLTNQFMQKKSPLYTLLKEDTVWSMDQLNRYINSKFRKTKGLPRDWVFTTFTVRACVRLQRRAGPRTPVLGKAGGHERVHSPRLPAVRWRQRRMQQIMAHCFLAVKPKLECKLGYFDLIGCDFLIDENFKVWLLEMNSNPALHTNCEVLKEVIPGVVTETLDLALETFQKSLAGRKMLPLVAQRRFVLLHNGEPDLWPGPGAARSGPCRLHPRLPCEAGASAPASRRDPDRPGARRPAPLRDPGGAPGPGLLPWAPRRPQPRVSSPDGARDQEASGSERLRAGDRDLAREPSPEERKSADHRDHRGS
ncbi:Protein polyglycylase TTLL10 [Galemys pyrenaicus]|uniref:Protein polyglycylase TTLL10 n=1 Tax=Galemys pyrenaicus TaxID=202257 RepID=A0A8J5ZQ07_GALPY|nr:Protein polyglycylase TTLL10 [Galemys pyrenaicus]